MRKVSERKESRRTQQRCRKRKEAKEIAAKTHSHYLRTASKIASAERAADCQCIEWYGFISNCYNPEWLNRLRALAQMNAAHYVARPSNVAFHNLCTYLTPPAGCLFLLGLGHKFCIESLQPPADFQQAMHHFKRDVQLKVWLTEHPPTALSNPEDTNYIPKLYIPSQWNPPKVKEGNLELAMMKMVNQIKQQAQQATARPRHTNLTPMQHHLM